MKIRAYWWLGAGDLAPVGLLESCQALHLAWMSPLVWGGLSKRTVGFGMPPAEPRSGAQSTVNFNVETQRFDIEIGV